MDLFPAVQAQGLDDVAVPTIPFNPPGGTGSPTPTAVSGPSISLSTDQFGIATGQTIEVDIVIDTRGQEVQEFNVQITYNPQLLEVVDAEPGTPNTQISYLDTFFIAETNQASTASGIINLKGASDQGAASISGRSVATIEFRAVQEGLGQVEIIKNNSSLVSSNNTDILQSVNSVSITVSDSTGTVTPLPTGGGGTLFPTQLPKNDLASDLGGGAGLFLGALFISFGILLIRKIAYARRNRIH
ncbi:MAG: Cohesin domain protein [candidate division WS6 bacterium OLB20]|uniref:Cohesin domain protein n=1 Tax=candidate division WS6 bacterium OLB20 TaxID=1617426 RepID=A0A136LW33_9BACT|nr:MAG: Cohesin domain protein [candidate division WS6 bacterium OLB20]